ncbi:unnamed protein product [Amaranthus hypochondriacus]
MECNKDEAMRAKDIAIRKFTEKDYAGAKKFALKAQSLYNGLEGITQMITTFDVFLSADTKINGEMDMYGVLGVTPLADEKTLKKHFNKLALQLHPDKNKSVGAEGAFQLVSEAYNFLRDKANRDAYDSRRSVKTSVPKAPSQTGVSTGSAGGANQPKFAANAGFSVPSYGGSKTERKVPAEGVFFGSRNSSQQNVPKQSVNSKVPLGANGYHKQPGPKSSIKKPPKSGNKRMSASIQSFKKGETFWTICTRCKMLYEFLRVYLNKILKCPDCELGFPAVEVSAPSNFTPVRPSKQKKPASSAGSQTFVPNSSFGTASARWTPLSGTIYRGPVLDNSFAAKSINEQWKAHEKGKSAHEAAVAAGKRKRNHDPGLSTEDGFLQKLRKIDEQIKNGISGQSGVRNSGIGMGSSPGQSIGNPQAGRSNSFAAFNPKVNSVRKDLSAVEIRKMLAEKARIEIRKKLKEWELAREAGIPVDEKEKQNSKLTNDAARQDLGNAKSRSGVKQKAAEMMSMTVPDPDFHVFDLDRSGGCFTDNQVWAAYDNHDGMPRFYAMIHEVISTDPFKVRLSWLNSKSSLEFGSLNWIGHGFNKSCGDFWVGKRELNTSLNSFSHKIKWVKGNRGVIQIYPQKGEIWAVYKNWSPDWNRHTPKDVVQAYDMVEVLNDYTDTHGVHVIPLLKSTGFRTVFHKQSDPNQIKHITKEQMFRFSHQVPSHVLTGEEGPNAVKGYVELDPAATTFELLQMTPGIEDPLTGSVSAAD